MLLGIWAGIVITTWVGVWILVNRSTDYAKALANIKESQQELADKLKTIQDNIQSLQIKSNKSKG